MTIAGLAQLARDGIVRRDERVVACITGTGLKTVEAFGDTLGASAVIEPSFDAFTALEDEWRNPE